MDKRVVFLSILLWDSICFAHGRNSYRKFLFVTFVYIIFFFHSHSECEKNEYYTKAHIHRCLENAPKKRISSFCYINFI